MQAPKQAVLVHPFPNLSRHPSSRKRVVESVQARARRLRLRRRDWQSLMLRVTWVWVVEIRFERGILSIEDTKR